jgi:hypothetical protein
MGDGMKQTGLDIGPYDLDVGIVRLATPIQAPGVYALGDMALDGRTFIVRYVGRSDEDLGAALERHAAERHYTAFRCAYYRSTLKAYQKERALLEAYEHLDNGRPVRSAARDNCRLDRKF